MLNSHNVSLSIGLSAAGITLLRTSGWFKKQRTVLADRACSEEDFATQLRSMLTEFKCDGLPVTITLSDTLARIWIVTPPQNTARLSDCQAATAARFQSLYGEPMTDWEFAADWDARHPFVACAMPRKLLQTLKTVADEHQLTLLEIAPQFIASWNRWRADIASTSWFGVLQDNVLTIGALHQQRLCAIRASHLPVDAWNDKAGLPQHLKREALRLNLAMPTQLQLCGPIPAHWLIHTAGTLHCTRLDGQQPVENTPTSAGATLAQARAQGSRS